MRDPEQSGLRKILAVKDGVILKQFGHFTISHDLFCLKRGKQEYSYSSAEFYEV